MDINLEMPHLTPEQYEKLSDRIANSKLSASQVILSRLVERQQSKIASMTPAERANFERRQADREKRLMEETQEHLSSHPWESFDEFLNAVAGDFFTFFTGVDDDLTDMTLDKLQERQAELEAARKRIDALLDANLKAQDVRRRLDRLEAQGEEIKAQGEEVKKIVAEKKAETEKRLAGQATKATELTRKLKTAEAENARLRENGAK